MAIYKRGRDSQGRDIWSLVVPLPRDPKTGKRKQQWVTYKGKKRDAEAEHHRLVILARQGSNIQTDRLTVAGYFDQWLQVMKPPKIKASTHTRYRELLNHLRPLIGAGQLTKLRPLQIQSAYTSVSDTGLSEKTVLNVHRVLSQCLKQAVRWQLINTNPADAVEPPHPAPFKAYQLTVDDVRRILDVTSQTHYRSLIHTLLFTGLRLGEALGLQWSDIDFESHVMQVRRTARRQTGQGVIFTEPKTRRSARSLSISPETVAELKLHRLAQAQEKSRAGDEYADQGLIFATGTGGPWDSTVIDRVWKRLAISAGIEKARVHDLRHAHASLLLKAGVPAKVISERLGHAAIGITMDTYASVLPGMDQDAAVMFDRLIVVNQGKGLENRLESMEGNDD